MEDRFMKVFMCVASAVAIICTLILILHMAANEHTDRYMPEEYRYDYMNNAFDEEERENARMEYLGTLETSEIEFVEIETVEEHIVSSPMVKETTEETTEENKCLCVWGGFEITPFEYDLMCKLVEREVGTECFDTRYMVALTVLNRVKSSYFPNNVTNVVYEPGQYAVVNLSNFTQTIPSQMTIDAVDRAMQENVHDEELFYFRSSHYFSFGKPYTNIGKVYFSTQD